MLVMRGMVAKAVTVSRSILRTSAAEVMPTAANELVTGWMVQLLDVKCSQEPIEALAWNKGRT